jgi:leucyl-tRNA synthetase
MALERVRAGKVEIGELIKAVMKEPELKPHAADLAKFLARAVREIRGMADERLAILAATEIDELQVLHEAAEFIRRQFGATTVEVFKADDPKRYDPKDRARLALPMKPAIFVE